MRAATTLSYLLHGVSVFDQHSGDHSRHRGSDLIAIDDSVLCSFDLIELVDSPKAVSFSVEHEELAVFFVELNLLQIPVSGDLNLSGRLKLGLHILELVVADLFLSFWVGYLVLDCVGVGFGIMD